MTEENSAVFDHTIEVLGSSTRYWQYHSSEKPTIVAIHGFRGTHHGLEFIAKALPDYCVIIPDLPGFGDSTPMKNVEHSAKNYAEFTRQFIARLDLKTPPILLGHSFGSVIAAQVAARYPEIIDRLILLNPIAEINQTISGNIGLGAAKLFYKTGSRLPEKTGSKLLASRSVTNLMTRFLAQTKNPTLKRLIKQQHLIHFSRFHNRTHLNEAFISSITDTVTQQAPQIQTASLLVGGASDVIVPPKAQTKLNTLFKRSQHIVIENTGHLLHYETPSQAAAIIKNFLEPTEHK